MIIAGAIIVAGAALQAYSAYQQAESEEKTYRYNARVAQTQADAARAAAAAEAESAGRQYQRLIGTQRARYGASGVLASEGSPLLVMLEQEEEAALDVARIRHGGAMEAFGFEAEAAGARYHARQARRTKWLRTTGTFLQGIAPAAGMYAKYKTPTYRAPSTAGPGAQAP